MSFKVNLNMNLIVSFSIPLQHCVLQYCEYVLNPEQLFPPHEGEGLLQLLERDLVPVPHDLLQVDQPAQDPQLPSTKMI